MNETGNDCKSARVVVYDFGCGKSMPQNIVQGYRELARAYRLGYDDQLLRAVLPSAINNLRTASSRTRS
jgi:hypothetical protein